MKLILSAAATIGFTALVSAHGYVDNATIAGTEYKFYQPYQDPYTSPTPDRISRPIQGNGPVEDLTSSDIQCGGYAAGGINGSSPAALHADAAAGDTIPLAWTLWPESHVGPTITYMAKCPDTGCNDYMPGSDAVWFKVQEDGRDGTTNTWGATALMKAGGTVSYTIPECITPGYYLVRHEIIALHSAYSYPGAQFYPGCHQLKVSGSGSTDPSDLVSIPGAYKAADAGITYDAYQATEYTIPGPALFSCSGGNTGSTSSKSASPAASSAAASSIAASSAAPVSSDAPASSATPILSITASPIVNVVTSTSASPTAAAPTSGSDTTEATYTLETFIDFLTEAGKEKGLTRRQIEGLLRSLM